MPTFSEVEELLATRRQTSYQWKWKTVSGHNGLEIVYLVNGNSVFLPAGGNYQDKNILQEGNQGEYWSSSLSTEYRDPDYAISMGFDNDHYGIMGDAGICHRCVGLPVRPFTE